MRDHELYEAILGIQLPWQVTSVTLDPKAEVRVMIEAAAGTRFPCPQFQTPCPGPTRPERKRSRGQRHRPSLGPDLLRQAAVNFRACLVRAELLARGEESSRHPESIRKVAETLASRHAPIFHEHHML